MKKAMAMILAILLVAVGVSGCASEPNFGFTRNQFTQQLSQRISQDGMNIPLEDWTYIARDDPPKMPGFHLMYIDTYISIHASCAQDISGPIEKLYIFFDDKELSRRSPHPENFEYLCQLVFELCEPNATEEQKQQFETEIMTPILQKDQSETRHKALINGHAYSFYFSAEASDSHMRDGFYCFSVRADPNKL